MLSHQSVTHPTTRSLACPAASMVVATGLTTCVAPSAFSFSFSQVAIKIEPVRTQHPQLLYEAKVLRHLRGGVGIPEILWVGTESDSNIMAIDLLGPSLEDLFNYCNRRFSLKTVLMVGEQMLTRIEYVHR